MNILRKTKNKDLISPTAQMERSDTRETYFEFPFSFDI